MLGMIQVCGNHRNLDDGAELEQMLLDEMLSRFATAKV